MAAPDTIKKLVDDFERLKGGPPPDSFDEAQLGTSYLEPFWEALGWAVRDPREVVKEKRVHLRASTRSADYCFQLARKPQFVVEAKDFRKRLDDPDFIFQTKRYGYNLPVDFGVLTNFDEFRLYDTGLQPVYENKARGLFKKFDLKYTDYEERWDELAAVFSRDAVAAGALRDLLPKARRTRNKEALDRKFFERLNEWRAELARNLALRNKDLSVHDINEAVQRILDRAIFMRVIEDRGIEATELLLDALHRWKAEDEKPLYRYVVDKFRYLDPQYNGELFEKHFSENLLVDDKPLRDFIESLYYPRCPYQFNVVGVEMLGTVYERFLGSEIRLTPTHRAVVEPKPEVRKAGGVYYTPKYIVDYIVENTVGELLKKCKTPAAAAKLKILDPACGSGSFLLGAFQRLIDWHEDYFTANPAKIGKGLAAACWYDADEEKHRLTAKYKGRILVNNIFGVDIDDQACEVTRMSLYLKLLEEVDAQYLMKTALLPQLDNNIKCGNSLIGSDYWDFVREKQEEMFERTPDEERRVNPFDWDVEFEDIMKAGGFDAVIGNPPYIHTRTGLLKERDKNYFKKEYQIAERQFDIFGIFIEKSYTLIRAGGYWSFIIPKRVISNENFQNVREWLLNNSEIISYLDTGMPFKEAGVESNVVSARIGPKPKEGKIRIDDIDSDTSEIIKGIRYIKPKNLSKLPYTIFPLIRTDEEIEIAVKIPEGKTPLGEILDITRGFECGFNDPSIVEGYAEGRKKVIKGENINRYTISFDNYYWIPNYDRRAKYKTKDLFEITPKILIRFVANGIIAAMDDFGYYTTNVLYNCHAKTDIDLYYLLGLLNSRLITWWFALVFASDDKLFPHIQKNQLEEIPIPWPAGSEESIVNNADEISALAKELTDLKKREQGALSGHDKELIGRQVRKGEKDIENLVFEIYGINQKERLLVENF